MNSRKILGASFAVLVLNSAYLAAFATPSLFYFTNVALHVVLGAATFVLALLWLKKRDGALPASWIATAALLGIGAILGGALAVTGAAPALRPLLLAHIAVASGGAVLAIVLAAAAALARRPRLRLQPLQIFYLLAVIGLTAWSSTVVGR